MDFWGIEDVFKFSTIYQSLCLPKITSFRKSDIQVVHDFK